MGGRQDEGGGARKLISEAKLTVPFLSLMSIKIFEALINVIYLIENI